MYNSIMSKKVHILILKIHFFRSLFIYLFSHPMTYGVPRPWIISELQLQPKLQLWQGWILSSLGSAKLGIKIMSQSSRDAANHVAPQWKLQKIYSC